MIIQHLEISNFMAIGEAKIKLSNTGLVLIQGQNHDDPSANSNGSGKSTIGDALFWCLYGETARGLKADSVVNATAGKGCCVSVVIEEGENLYRVSRHRKHPQHKNTLIVETKDGGDWTNVSKGTDKATQELVEAIIGSSREIFTAAVYAAQDALPDLPAMTDKNLKILVEEAAGVNVLEQAHDIARARAKDAAEDLRISENRLENENSKLDVEKFNLDKVIQTEEGWFRGFDLNIEQAKVALKDAFKEYKAMSDKHDELAPQLEALDKDISDKHEFYNVVQKEEEQLEIHKKKVRDAETVFERIGYLLKDKKAEFSKYKAKVESAESMVGEPCDNCGKLYEDADIKDVLDGFVEKLGEIRKEFGEIKDRYDNAKKIHDDAVLELTAYKSSMTDASAEFRELNDLQNKRRKLNDEIYSYAMKRDRLKHSAQNIKEQLEEFQAQKESGLSPYSEFKDRHKENIDALEKSIKEMQTKVEDCEKRKAIADSAASVFSPSGVRAHILDQVTPFLNDRTAHYLGTLSDGLITAYWQTLTTNRSGDIREKFSIDVKKDGGSDSFVGLSGGEKRKVRLSCALALQDLVASRASKPINLWIGDEIDDALDANGLERLMGVLEEKAREKGSVLVISHNELRDWIRDVITVNREDNVSTIEGVLAL